MRKQIPAIVAMLLMMRPIFAFQKPRPDPIKKPALTDEEKGILKNREILENLDLLQNFEKFRFLGFFAEENPKETKSGKAATNKDGKKEK
jgi:hypothetical protein